MLRYIRTTMHHAKDRGASAVEYGLMVAAIAAVIVGIVFGLGKLVSGTFNTTCSKINGGTAQAANAAAPATGNDCSGNAPAAGG